MTEQILTPPLDPSKFAELHTAAVSEKATEAEYYIGNDLEAYFEDVRTLCRTL